MNKSRVEVWVWVLVYGGLLTVAVSIFMLRAGAEGLGWAMLVVGALAAAGGAALVVVRARMETAPAPKKGSPK